MAARRVENTPPEHQPAGDPAGQVRTAAPRTGPVRQARGGGKAARGGQGGNNARRYAFRRS